MINAKIKLEIMRHANDVYPNECCGLVTQKSRVQKYHRIDNVSKEPEKHFEMDAEQYAEVEDGGADIIAIVHSHTGEGATTIPSAHDLCMCDETGVSWVIVSIPEGDMRIIEPQSRPLIGRPGRLELMIVGGLLWPGIKSKA
ncbi:hypothetical protein DDONNNOJ_00045 [Citrobacter phage BSwS KMM3]|nr:hypothetical protein DDONNNOJ_00045 [Citrobacter phage BSwS KMM3]